jgi:hypothetical protein
MISAFSLIQDSFLKWVHTLVSKPFLSLFLGPIVLLLTAPSNSFLLPVAKSAVKTRPDTHRCLSEDKLGVCGMEIWDFLFLLLFLF